MKTTSLFIAVALLAQAASAADPAIEASRILGTRAMRATGKSGGIMFYIPRKDSAQKAAKKLKGVLPAMAAGDEPLVLGGPDAQLTGDVARIVFSPYPAGSLRGLTVVCALPPELAKPLAPIVTRTGAKFFVISPEF